ncbi:MAG: phosphodiester glycosidase family protein [Archangiaceae bacterium]|nr:phosphodiester glycosidase family protein [Archangiaceae bacterium]
MLALVLAAASSWVVVSDGVERRTLDGLQLVRVSAPATLDLGSGERRTAAAWAREQGARVAFNASMFQTDLRTSTGHLHCGKRVNQAAWSRDYQSVLVFRPLAAGLPAFTLVDLDQSGAKETIAKYDCAVQNLRLIKAPGESVWQSAPRRWSEAALALDRQGRLVFVFSQRPVTMPDLIERLLKSDLELVRAMHLDGGPEASLSLRSGGAWLDFTATDEPVALPNVLLVK